MIDFSPLHETLKRKDMKISDLRGIIGSSKTVTRINQNKSVRLDTVDKLCVYLDVPIQDVVRITKER
ncbi:helix-turn-helix domain-containing protein [Bacillus sp. JJ722]|uniref:helix-turn-helix domain-containing protein n=1 Tax=Bacillus sp. JJ722 TaxID=3122973 RepID=UPI0030009137